MCSSGRKVVPVPACVYYAACTDAKITIKKKTKNHRKPGVENNNNPRKQKKRNDGLKSLGHMIHPVTHDPSRSPVEILK